PQLRVERPNMQLIDEQLVHLRDMKVVHLEFESCLGDDTVGLAALHLPRVWIVLPKDCLRVGVGDDDLVAVSDARGINEARPIAVPLIRQQVAWSRPVVEITHTVDRARSWRPKTE